MRAKHISYGANEVTKARDAFLECALWSSIGYENDDGSDEGNATSFEMDSRYTIEDIDDESKMRAWHLCHAFVQMAVNLNLIDRKETDFVQFGYDFWLSQAGHGSGFFERANIYGKENADTLQMMAESFGIIEAMPDGNQWFLI